MRHQIWAVAIATTPIALWSAPRDDVQSWFTQAPPDLSALTEHDDPRRLYRAGQALEYSGDLHGAQELYSRAADTAGSRHELSDDIQVARQILTEKLRNGTDVDTQPAVMLTGTAPSARSDGGI